LIEDWRLKRYISCACPTSKRAANRFQPHLKQFLTALPKPSSWSPQGHFLWPCLPVLALLMWLSPKMPPLSQMIVTSLDKVLQSIQVVSDPLQIKILMIVLDLLTLATANITGAGNWAAAYEKAAAMVAQMTLEEKASVQVMFRRVLLTSVVQPHLRSYTNYWLFR
jgi:hypothetical protein